MGEGKGGLGQGREEEWGGEGKRGKGNNLPGLASLLTLRLLACVGVQAGRSFQHPGVH